MVPGMYVNRNPRNMMNIILASFCSFSLSPLGIRVLERLI